MSRRLSGPFLHRASAWFLAGAFAWTAGAGSSGAVDLATLRGHAEGRQLLRAGDLPGAQAAWDSLLSSRRGSLHAIALEGSCDPAVVEQALERRRSLQPLWVAGEDCRTLLWGAFETAAEAEAQLAALPAGLLPAGARVVELTPPLAGLSVNAPEPSEPVRVARAEPEPVEPPAPRVVEPPAPRVVPRPREEVVEETIPPPAVERPVAPEPVEEVAPPAAREPEPAKAPEPEPPAEPSDGELAARSFARGNELWARGDFAGAVEAFEEARGLDPENPRILNNLGTAHLKVERPERAVEVLSRAVELDAGYARGWLNLAIALTASGRPAEALQAFDRSISLEPGNLDAYHYQAALLAQLERWSEAESTLKQGLEQAPGDARLSDFLREVQMQQSAREAIAQRQAEPPPRPEPPRPQAPPPEPAPRVREQVPPLPTEPEGLTDEEREERRARASRSFAEGNALWARGEYEAAIASFETALELDPDNTLILNNLGTAWIQAERPDRAVAVLRRAVELDPSYSRAYLNLGTALYAAGDLEASLAALRKVVELRPDNLDARYNEAAVLAELRRYAQAKQSLERSLQVAPGDPRLTEFLQQVEQQIRVTGPGTAAAASGPCAGMASDVLRARRAAELFREGETAAAGRSWSEAIEAYLGVLDCDPTSAAAANRLGAARLSAGDAAGAQAAFALAKRLDPEFVEAQVNACLASFATDSCGRAVDCLEGVVASAPAFAPARREQALMLYRCGRSIEAESAAVRGLELDPDDARLRQLMERIEGERVGSR